jgi:hypothetical protein
MHGDLAAAWQANSAGFVWACLGVGATVWMLGVAVGQQPTRYSVSDAINWLIVAATITTLTRWVRATLLSAYS